MDSKPTNPKDIVGSTKLSLGAVPDTLTVLATLAFTEGALKYGRYNWRLAGVRASIYNDALKRHLMKWWNGEEIDPVTKVPHLASVIACAGIILDAELCGKLTDDRPPRAPVSTLIAEQDETLRHLKELFKEHAPYQYTIRDEELWSMDGIVLGPQPTEEQVNEFNTTTFGPPIAKGLR